MDSAPPSSNLYPGMRLGRYELLCPVAQGGMAQVWVARMQGDLGFQRLVAIKAILAQHALDPRFRLMFLDEARLVTGIHHPNVAQLLDLGEHNEVLYHVLEWVDGDSVSSLRRVVHGRREKMPLGVVLRIVSDTCAGLHAAHELRGDDGTPLGVVHRDVSPANVLCSSSGEIKVIDFGIAKSIDRMSEETSAGILKGKVTYMAPEQVLGKELDRRADVWACGVMLYHMLSGRLPYEAENQVATLHLLIRGMPPAPLKGVPADVAEIVYTALAYTPEGRFETAEEMHRALESLLAQRCGAVTASDVAAYVDKQLGERIGKRKQTIERALRAADERSQIAGEYEQVIPTDSNLLHAPELRTPASLRTAETALALASIAVDPPSSRGAGPPLGLVDLGASDDRALQRFGTRSRLPLVIGGFVAALALVGYAGYLVWDRVSAGDLQEAPPGR
jgi:eukaryotic-like serine/threonine-protein kinase